jgi:hypothetical protein
VPAFQSLVTIGRLFANGIYAKHSSLTLRAPVAAPPDADALLIVQIIT